ncbi:MAG: hypothetical protein ABEI53_02455 [Candidatus Magasanikbacteria bacterium]
MSEVEVPDKSLEVVKKSVDREKRITELKLERLRERVESFEGEYGMESDEFRERFESGELGDDKDFMEWDVYLDAIEELEQRREELSKFGR